MGNHTPGPWTVRTRLVVEHDRAVYCGARRIASVPHPDRLEPSPENDANARLIAAAPELLEALEKTLDAMRRLRGLAWTGSRIPASRYPEYHISNEADAAARAAIAKVRGE